MNGIILPLSRISWMLQQNKAPFSLLIHPKSARSHQRPFLRWPSISEIRLCRIEYTGLQLFVVQLFTRTNVVSSLKSANYCEWEFAFQFGRILSIHCKVKCNYLIYNLKLNSMTTGKHTIYFHLHIELFISLRVLKIFAQKITYTSLER